MNILVLITLAVIALFGSGCSHIQPSVELQCISPALREEVSSPVIVKDDAVIFYDSKGKLRKVVGTCGVKGN